MNVTCKTKSGIDMTPWVQSAIEIEGASRNTFLFSDNVGKRERGGVYEDYLFTMLERVQREHSEHILASI